LVAGLWIGVNRFRKLSAVGEIAHRHRTWSRPRLAGKELDRTLYCLHSGILRWNKIAPSALFDYPFIFGGEVSPVVRLKPKQGEQAQNLFREISQEFQKQENLAVEMIHHQLRSLMVHLARLYAATSPAPFAAIGLVRRFHQAVERSFRASTSVRDYAQMLGVTTSHLTASLRLETGLTAGELIRARLLLEAKRLLLHSELTIAEIGYELGFEDPSYFSRFVRREVETSPVELRNRIREKYRKFMQ
jgi:AraC family transcriptional activator of pobA